MILRIYLEKFPSVWIIENSLTHGYDPSMSKTDHPLFGQYQEVAILAWGSYMISAKQLRIRFKKFTETPSSKRILSR